MVLGREAISHLLSLDPKIFYDKYYGKQRAFNSGGAIPLFSILPNINDLDSLYFALDLAGSRLGVVDGHASPSSGTSLVRKDGRVRLDEVHAAYQSGKTLLLTHLQNSHLGTARLARSIECQLQDSGVLLRKEVGANLFLTPPDARGFDPHYDGHDVLIIQLAGGKVWRVFDQLKSVAAGMEGGRLTSEQLSERTETFNLIPGDVLYLPRGRPHAAFTADLNSLHLTLSVVPLTTADILAEEIRVNGDIDQRIDIAPQVAKIEISDDRAKKLKEDLWRNWLEQLNTLPDGAPWMAHSKSMPLQVRLTDGMIVKIEDYLDENSFGVRMPGAYVKLGIDGRQAVLSLVAGKTVSPAEISLGGRSIQSRERFLQSLIDVGLASAVVS